jgi:hypothetical protein
MITLKTEAVRTSETSVYSNETTRRYIPEGSNLKPISVHTENDTKHYTRKKYLPNAAAGDRDCQYKQLRNYSRSEVFTALKMSIVVLWAETPSDFVG